MHLKDRVHAVSVLEAYRSACDDEQKRAPAMAAESHALIRNDHFEDAVTKGQTQTGAVALCYNACPFGRSCERARC